MPLQHGIDTALHEAWIPAELPPRDAFNITEDDDRLVAAGDIHYASLSRQTNEFRLVQILSGSSEPIKCEIASFELGHAPPFVALSYRWGNRSSDRHVYLNNRKISVGKNLWRFLRMAQSSSRYRDQYIWIDALCIDQRNVFERNHQVGLMGQIFKSVAQVVVWLGPSYGDSTLAIKAFAMHNQRKSKAGMWAKAEGSAVRRLCQRPYWTRLWVLQELVLAKEVLLTCGSEEIPWHRFVAFVEHITTQQPKFRDKEGFEYRHTLESPGIAMTRQVRDAHKECSLYGQLLASQHLECFEIRDKIYGLLGIAGSGHESIEPNYATTIPELLNTVLRSEHQVRPPSSLEQVATQCSQIASALGTEPAVMLSREINLTEGDRRRPKVTLHWAAHYNHTAIVRLWAASTNDDLDSTLLAAAATGNVTALSRIIEGIHGDLTKIVTAPGHSFSPKRHDSVGVGGMTALHLAAESGHSDVVEYLLAMNKNPLGRFRYARGPRTRYRDLEQPLNVPLTRWTDVLDNDGRMPLYLSVRGGWVETVALLTPCSTINLHPISDVSLLHVATIHGHTAVVEELLKHREIDLHVGRGSKLGTPLYFAAKRGREEIIRTLLRFRRLNPDLGRCTRDTRESPLQVAASNGRGDIVSTLLQRTDTSINGKLTFVAWIDGEVDASSNGVLVASNNGAYNVISSNVEFGGPQDTDLVSGNKSDLPLHAAIKGRHTSIAKLLLARTDLDVNAFDNDGCTALYLAVGTGDSELVQLLLERKDLDVRKRNQNGETPFRRSQGLTTSVNPTSANDAGRLVTYAVDPDKEDYWTTVQLELSKGPPQSSFNIHNVFEGANNRTVENVLGDFSTIKYLLKKELQARGQYRDWMEERTTSLRNGTYQKRAKPLQISASYLNDLTYGETFWPEPLFQDAAERNANWMPAKDAQFPKGWKD